MVDLVKRTMTHTNAIRFLAHQARLCRDRDSCEAFCLLLPAMVRIFEMEAMQDIEAEAFKYEFRLLLQKLPFQDAADREASRPAVLAHALQPQSPHECGTNRNGREGAQAGRLWEASAAP